MSSQEDPTNWISFPFQWPLGAGSSGTAVTSSATALAGTSALPPSLPRAGLALLYPSIPLFPGMKCTDPGSSQPSASSHLLLCRDTACGHTETRTHSTPRAAAGSALQGVTTFIFLGIWREGSNQCSETAFGRSTLAPSYQSL